MPLGHHTPQWYEQRNRALGLPPGTRHSDEWYATNLPGYGAGTGPYGTGPVAPPPPGTGGSGPYFPAPPKQDDPSVGTPMAPTPPVVTPPSTSPTAAELATAETDRQAKMRARRDEWDRLNNQGKYDPDGWQSMGYQPDPVAMPSWWLDGLELGTTAPAVPLPVPPVVAPPVVPPASPAPGTSLPVAGNAGPPAATNPLAQLFGPVGPQQPPQNALSQATGGQVQPQPWTQKPAGQAQPAGVWGQNPFAAQQPDPGAWGQQPAATKSTGLQSWAQPAGQNLGLWGQKPPKQSKPLGVWGQKPAGTWGAP